MIATSKLSVVYREILTQIIRKKSTLPKYTPKLKCGQPTAETHPHLLKTGEVVPYINANEFQTRRQGLIDQIVAYNNANAHSRSHLVIIPSATKKYMSDKIPYVFRQNTDYLYLSGCLEPDSCLVINTTNSSNHYSTLFVRNPDSHSELWDGPRTAADIAPSIFGVDHSLPMSDLETFLQSYIASTKNCTIWYDIMDALQPGLDRLVRDLRQSSLNVRMESPKQFVHKLRLIKSLAEINLMKKSCDIASEAINDTMAFSKPDMSEHQIYAKVDYECRMRGAEYLAYPPVVAGGERATIIHYINNNQRVPDGEMVLMDAGCEYHGYSSDITRTWPVNGRFSPEQKLIYEVVHSVQADLIKLLQNYPSLDNLFDNMCVLLGKRLQEIGLIPQNVPSELLFKTAYEFCPHHVSHYLGMDVHDTHLMPRNIRLQPGMIITMEPGIYINERHKVPPEFKGLGVRIEDDVLITDNGPVILTNKCLKNLDDIENLLSKME